MDLHGLRVFGSVKQNMAYLKERQKVLAENVANANTPGYAAKDLEKPDFAQFLKSSTSNLAVTHEKHFSRLPSQTSIFKTYVPKPSVALTLDGNGVDIEEQMNEIAKTKMEYGKMISIYGKHRDLIRAAGKGISG